MGKKLQHASAAALLLLPFSLLLLLSSTSPIGAEARQVVGLRAVDLSSATMPAAGVALPKEALGRSDELAHTRENGCDMGPPAMRAERPPTGVGAAMKGEKLGELYGPLLLNLLPRGITPPSAPSTGINDNRT